MTDPRDIPDEVRVAAIAEVTRLLNPPTTVDAVDIGDIVSEVLLTSLPFLSAERDAALARAEQAEARADKLAEALRFYADEVNYIDGVPGEWVTYPGRINSYTGLDETEFVRDNGERARAALADTTPEARDTTEETG